MHQVPPFLSSLVGQQNIDLMDIITKIIIVISVALIRHAGSPCSFSSRWLLFLWALEDDSFSSLHLTFSVSFSLSFPSFISPNRWFTLSLCLSFALLAISQSSSLQRVITHWAHQPTVNSFHPLTDESEKGAVARLTASSEQKHINGSASD